MAMSARLLEGCGGKVGCGGGGGALGRCGAEQSERRRFNRELDECGPPAVEAEMRVCSARRLPGGGGQDGVVMLFAGG